MKFRFYHAEPGGGSGAAADAAPANQPGPQGDPASPEDKSTAGAKVSDGSGTGAPPPAPPEPQTIEEAKALLAEQNKKIGELSSQVSAKQSALEAKKKDFAKRMREQKAIRVPAPADEAPIKPRGADGKFTPQDMEEMQLRTTRKIQREQHDQQLVQQVRDYMVDFATTMGLKEADVDAAEETFSKYRRVFTLDDGETEADPVMDLAEQADFMETYLKGKHHDAIVEARLQEAIAERDQYWTKKIANGGAPEGTSLVQKTLGAGENGVKTNLSPAAREVVESIKRIRAGAGA